MSTMTLSNLSAEAAKFATDAEKFENNVRQQLADLKSQHPWVNFDEVQFDFGGEASPTTTKSPSSPPKRKRGPGRPKGSSAAAPKSTATKKRGPGRPKGSKNKSKADKVKPTERNYSNKISLREAIWQILDMGPDGWAKHLTDLADDALGLTAAEVREMIEITKIWESASSNISNQVTQHLHRLKKEGKIAREAKQYYIVEGAEL